MRCLVRWSFGSGRDSHRILVAARPIDAGAVLAAEDVRAVEVSGTPAFRSTSPDQLSSIVGRVATGPIAQGSVVTVEQFRVRQSAPEGSALLAVVLEPGALPTPDLRFGDQVDVMVSSSPNAVIDEPARIVTRASVWRVWGGTDGGRPSCRDTGGAGGNGARGRRRRLSQPDPTRRCPDCRPAGRVDATVARYRRSRSGPCRHDGGPMSVALTMSAKGAPGVSLAGWGVLHCWPRMVVGVEADISGGSWALTHGLTCDPGLTDLAAEQGVITEEALARCSVEVGVGKRMVCAPREPIHVRRSLKWLEDRLAAWPEHIDVIVDAGRVDPSVGHPMLGRADALVVCTHTTAVALGATAALLEGLDRVVRSDVVVRVVTVGESPYSSAEAVEALRRLRRAEAARRTRCSVAERPSVGDGAPRGRPEGRPCLLGLVWPARSGAGVVDRVPERSDARRLTRIDGRCGVIADRDLVASLKVAVGDRLQEWVAREQRAGTDAQSG